MRSLRMVVSAVLLMGAGTAPVWAQEADKPCTSPDQPLRPITATHTQPPYPALSVMTNEEGNTLLEVAIGADGVPTDAITVNSSGSLRLDAAAVEHVKNTWRWNAPVRACKPMAVRTRVVVHWYLRDAPDTAPQTPTVHMDDKDYPPGARQRHEQGNVILMVVVLPDGQVTTTVANTSGFQELDDKSLEVAKRWHFTPVTMDGHAVPAATYVITAWSLDPKK